MYLVTNSVIVVGIRLSNNASQLVCCHLCSHASSCSLVRIHIFYCLKHLSSINHQKGKRILQFFDNLASNAFRNFDSSSSGWCSRTSSSTLAHLSLLRLFLPGGKYLRRLLWSVVKRQRIQWYYEIILMSQFRYEYHHAFLASFLRRYSSIFLASAAFAFSCSILFLSAYYQSAFAWTKSRSNLTSSLRFTPYVRKCVQ